MTDRKYYSIVFLSGFAFGMFTAYLFFSAIN